MPQTAGGAKPAEPVTLTYARQGRRPLPDPAHWEQFFGNSPQARFDIEEAMAWRWP